VIFFFADDLMFVAETPSVLVLSLRSSMMSRSLKVCSHHHLV